MKYLVCSALLLSACGSSEPSSDAPSGPSVSIRVAALALPEVADACYTLSVTNEADELVWSQAGICASRYGSGADIAYVGTCDATDVDGGAARNLVTLTIDGLYRDGGGAIDFVDPCAAPHNPDGCQLWVDCTENADRAVNFDLTIMRGAHQGFFDIGVDFSDIFCSAKVDCVDGAGQPLRLVFDPDSDARVDTVVAALACTDGSDVGDLATATHLYRDPVAIVCGSERYEIDPSAGPGNVYPDGEGAPAPIVQAMVFEGTESLPNAATGFVADKVYWNVALGLDTGWLTSRPAGTTCYL